jgi:hypothetical protein
VSRAAFPLIKIGLVLTVILVGYARVRAKDLPASNQEITRCLAACRAVCARRIADTERLAKCPKRGAGERIAA